MAPPRSTASLPAVTTPNINMARGRSNKGGRKSGGGRGNSGGGGGQAAPPQAPAAVVPPPKQQQQAKKVELRLFQLTKHQLLKSINYLDEESRMSAFDVMGWPKDNYKRRKQLLLDEVVAFEKKKLEEEEKGEEETDEATEGEEGVEGGGKELVDINTMGAVEEEEGSEPHVLVEEKNHEVEVATTDGEQDKGEAAAEVEVNTVQVHPNDPNMILVGGITLHKNDPRILPLLAANIGAEELLDRLNTRRLYGRILYYKRERRNNKVETNQHDDDDDEEKDGFASIKEDTNTTTTHENKIKEELKQQKTNERIWRKNMSIKEIAEKEWDELLDLANERINNRPDPYYPVPTQHELLLFSQIHREVGVLASYPRSGNSLMRTLYEHTTLRVTGSDMQGGLAQHDLVGEMAVGANLVQFVKTHYPERQGSQQFYASRVVLLVRNPFDAIESYFNLMMTGKHTDSVSPEVRAKTVKIFEEYVVKEIRVWKAFHNFWLEQDIPLLLIRYEDIVRYPDKVMARVLKFVLEVKRMDTFFDERIARCISDQQEIERLGSYKPRSGGIGKSLSKYSPELLAQLKADEELCKVMGYLEYTELLDKPANEWDTLPPLKDYAYEFSTSWMGKTKVHQGKVVPMKKVCLLNRNSLARGQDEQTHWMQIKKDLAEMKKKEEEGGEGEIEIKTVDAEKVVEDVSAKEDEKLEEGVDNVASSMVTTETDNENNNTDLPTQILPSEKKYHAVDASLAFGRKKVEHVNVIPQPRTFQQVTPSVNNNTLFDMDKLMKLVSTEWENEKKTKKR